LAPFASQYHPGEGRGPVGKVVITKRSPQLATSPNWAPASAGVGIFYALRTFPGLDSCLSLPVGFDSLARPSAVLT